MNGIGKLALGTMGMNFANKESSIQTIWTAIENGINIFNTGDFYQKGESQVVLGEALKHVSREDYYVSLKFEIESIVSAETIKGQCIRKTKETCWSR